VRSEDAVGPGLALSLRSLSKSFKGVKAVHDVTLEIAAGEFMTFLGPSGSGKTTTLNMISGFAQPTSGQIVLGDTDISRVPPHRRGIGMVFQHYALFPHMTVAQNVAYPLRQRKVARLLRRERVREALELVELDDFAGRWPAELSGGQQQRVALARALVFRPPVLLMDEPLGALDRRLREALQVEIKRIHEELGITFVYVTHDQDEALLLSDRIAVFTDGRIDQVGTAEELYERPRTRFVAEFLGDSNVFFGVVDSPGSTVRLDTGSEIRAQECPDVTPGTPASLMVRPERMRIKAGVDDRQPYANLLGGVVTVIRYLGSARKIEVESGGRTVTVREPADRYSDVRPGDEVSLCWNPADCVVIVEGTVSAADARDRENAARTETSA
jgi:putative spermidine/putrescine transport system ATP-binding protein